MKIFFYFLNDPLVENDVNITRLPDHKCTTDRCKVSTGSILKVDRKFIAIKDTDIIRVYTRSHYTSGWVEILYEDDACKHLYSPDGKKFTCPVKKDQAYVYKRLYYVSPRHQKVSY